MSLPLVTRYGADPTLDLEVANKRYVDSNPNSLVMFGQSRHDTITNNEGNGWYSSLLATTLVVNRAFTPSFAGTMSRYCHDVQSNSNTIDGAQFELEVNDVVVNEVVVIDQATGFFQDITNTDTYLLGDNSNWIYRQGNAAVNNFTAAVSVSPT